MPFYDRKTPRLRRGRISSPGASYFITLCTKNRSPALTEAVTGRRVIETLLSMHGANDMELLAATAMPDHAHLLLNLGDRLRLAQVLGKFKTLSRDQGRASWHWQEAGFEHRLRNIEAIEDYGFYIFMNPYRAELCTLATAWPWWLCPDPSVFRFLDALKISQTVPSAWLDQSDQIATRLITRD